MSRRGAQRQTRSAAGTLKALVLATSDGRGRRAERPAEAEAFVALGRWQNEGWSPTGGISIGCSRPPVVATEIDRPFGCTSFSHSRLVSGHPLNPAAASCDSFASTVDPARSQSESRGHPSAIIPRRGCVRLGAPCAAWLPFQRVQRRLCLLGKAQRRYCPWRRVVVVHGGVPTSCCSHGG